MTRNLNNYRIKAETTNGTTIYTPQRNWFGLWFNMFEVCPRNYDKFTSYESARDAILSELPPRSVKYLYVIEPN